MNRRLFFDGIKLVPVATDYYPYYQERYRDMWHVPGRVTMSTEALVTLANAKGVAVSVVEHVGRETYTTRLN